jgi:hypothetical protein
MLLLDIRDHVQLVGSITLTDLARRFDRPESAIQGMMEQWVRKGNVSIVNNDVSCSTGSCGGCSQGSCAGSAIKYVWQEK